MLYFTDRIYKFCKKLRFTSENQMGVLKSEILLLNIGIVSDKYDCCTFLALLSWISHIYLALVVWEEYLITNYWHTNANYGWQPCVECHFIRGRAGHLTIYVPPTFNSQHSVHCLIKSKITKIAG